MPGVLCRRGFSTFARRGYANPVEGERESDADRVVSVTYMCDGSELYTVGAVEGLGLVGPHEDECAAVPDLDTATILPWDKSQVWFHSDLYYHGEPYRGDPRGVLRRVLERARSMGFVFNLGIEPELYVLRESPDGTLAPITRTRFRGPNACYDLALATESDAFLAPMVRYMRELGWGLYSYDQECGRGQYEFDFAYSDALTTADRFIFLRFMAKKVAQSVGAVATFMAKPFADDFRSGAHFNMSLADAATGANVFAPGHDRRNALATRYGVKCSDVALHFVAGLRRHARAITAVTCPSYNSYQGLIAQGDLREFSWAPVLIAWGKNNRSAMLRLPGNRYCVENRAVDMSTNPYLAAAISLSAGLDGIEQQLDPGEPLNDDLYKRGVSGCEQRDGPRRPRAPAADAPARPRSLRRRPLVARGVRRLSRTSTFPTSSGSGSERSIQSATSSVRRSSPSSETESAETGRRGQASRSAIARSTAAVPCGLRSGPPATWPQSESRMRSSADGMCETSSALSSGGK